jgi:hydrogenase nickel incorporation protein HypA/HybF
MQPPLPDRGRDAYGGRGMHELAITQSVVDMVVERTAGRQIAAVHLQVGQLSGVVPDAMQFCYELVTAGTALEGSALDIDHTAGRAHCRSCGADFDLDELILLCPCGSADVRIVAGQELLVTSVEMVVEPCA